MVDGALEYIFEDPLYNSTCRIRTDFLERAVRLGVKMRIVVPNKGSALIDPVHWIKNGKKFSQVFRDPKNPMRLTEVTLSIASLLPPPSKRDAKILAKKAMEKAQAKLF